MTSEELKLYNELPPLGKYGFDGYVAQYPGCSFDQAFSYATIIVGLENFGPTAPPKTPKEIIKEAWRKALIWIGEHAPQIIERVGPILDKLSTTINNIKETLEDGWGFIKKVLRDVL